MRNKYKLQLRTRTVKFDFSFTRNTTMYNYHLMVELFKKEKKFQKVYTNFRPNLNVSPVTSKFYSRHEKDIDKGDPNDYYMELLTKAESLGPKNKFSSPQTESQRYGWYDKTFTPRKENILLFPLAATPEIKLDMVLKQNYKNDVHFSGTPFKF